jgi:hypothetical protein
MALTSLTQPASTLSIESAELTDAGSYTVVVTDDVGSTTSDPATLTVTDEEPDGPTITTQPQSQTVAPGAPVTFTVVAEGTGTLLYQWAKDGVDIADATASTLSIESAELTDAGSYTVVVTDDVGSTTSEGAVLTVEAVEPTGSGSRGSASIPPMIRRRRTQRRLGSRKHLMSVTRSCSRIWVTPSLEWFLRDRPMWRS